MSDEPKLDCCADMIRGQQEGTDMEGYGCGIRYQSAEDVEIYKSIVNPIVGWYCTSTCSTQPMHFCPWCGRAITE